MLPPVLRRSWGLLVEGHQETGHLAVLGRPGVVAGELVAVLRGADLQLDQRDRAPVIHDEGIEPARPALRHFLPDARIIRAQPQRTEQRGRVELDEVGEQVGDVGLVR